MKTKAPLARPPPNDESGNAPSPHTSSHHNGCLLQEKEENKTMLPSRDKIPAILALLPTLDRTRGKEIEYHIVDEKTGRRATAEEALAFWAWLDGYPRWDLLQSKGITRDTFALELSHWLVELNSPVFRTHAELRPWLNNVLDFLREGLQQFGLALIGVDVHPHAVEGGFGLADIPESPEYLRDIWCRGALRSRPFIGNPFGRSGHVASEQDQYMVAGVNGTQALRVRNQGLPLVPLFTGGTANGPLCVPARSPEVVDSGLATVRHDWLGVLENFGIGPIFKDEDEFVEWLEEEVAAGRVDAKRAKLYHFRQWRGEHRVATQQKEGGARDTHEHREKGTQSRPEDTLAWSAFDETVYDWVFCLYALGEAPFPYMSGPRREIYGPRINADRITAARDGLSAVIANPFTGDQADRLTVSKGILLLADEVEPLMEAKGLLRGLERVREIANGDAAYLLLRRAFEWDGEEGALQYLLHAMNG
jgi:gamma-glutamyl:cysteine ligase YbdK (ATP-grasp superfamily)